MFIYRRIHSSLLVGLLLSLVLLSSCFTVTVKNHPAGKPFVYETNVHVQGKYSTDDRTALQLGLLQQLDDSLRVVSVSKAVGWLKGPKFFYSEIKAATPFDSLSISRSVGFMRALLASNGYFRDSIWYTVKVKEKADNQLRTTIDFYVRPGTITTLDSISYLLNPDTGALATHPPSRDTIQAITLASAKESLLRKGAPFSKSLLASERDRLANVYRDNGYLRFSEEELLVLWDTVGIGLLRFTLDPIEQATQLQELARRRAAPRADVEYRLRENPDTSRTTRYYIGNVTIYPDFTADTSRRYSYADSIGPYGLRFNRPLFKKTIFPESIFLTPGEMYRQSNYLKTQNKFNALSAWRLVSISQNPRPGQDTADFNIRLSPAKKYINSNSLDLNRNQGNVTLARGNLLGVALSSNIQNRNFARRAIQSITNFRFGVELNATFRDLIQTLQFNLGHTIQIPRLVPPVMRRFSRNKENAVSTFLSLGAGNISRRDYFSLTTLNTSLGYQFGWRNKTFNIRFPNIEYNYLIRRDSLTSLIAKNASYKYIFNTGLIVSAIGTYTINKARGNTTSFTSLSGELSGWPGFLRNAFSITLYRFAKVDAEYRRTRKLGKNALAFRVFAGVGIGMPTSPTDSFNRYLPFYRGYFAGGPNSMRAWSVRKLGPGSSIKTFKRDSFPDRFGDARFEANLEYRIYLTTYKGIGLNTALFTDIGNIWFWRDNPDFPGGRIPGTFDKLWKDLAIGVGTGLRVDFGFLKVRLDYAFKAKNPNPETLAAQNKWFYGLGLLSGQLQLGIDYPF